MSYFEKIGIYGTDSPSLDAFGRWRVSGLTTVFDSKQIYDSGSLYWSTKLIGNATASYDVNSSAVRLTTTGSNSAAIRQTKRYFNYQPGKSQLILCTTNFGDDNNPNTIDRVGYFDHENGIFFQVSASNISVGLRSKTSGIPVDTYISQSDWNIDKFDGTGASGETLDLSKSQIIFFDMEWLGAGRVRYGIFKKGLPYYVHAIDNDNTLTYDEPVYMTLPNLPIRYETINSGSASSFSKLVHLCSSVSSEGGVDITGVIRSVDVALSQSITINTDIHTPILAIRLQSGRPGTTVVPIGLSTKCNNDYRYALLLNPLTSSNFTFQSVLNSSVEWAQGTGTTTLTASLLNEGTKLISGFVSTNTDHADVPINTEVALGTNLDGTRDVLVLTMINYAVGAAAQASLIWREAR